MGLVGFGRYKNLPATGQIGPGPHVPYAHVNLSMKSALTLGRTIRFIGSDESIDRDGDTISVDGWDITAYMKNPVVIYGHDYSSLPVARAVSVTPDKRARQLIFDIKFPTIEELSSNPATPSEHALRVDAIYNMAKAGILNTVSVGFRGIEYDSTATGRAYKKQELMEISIVPVPANPNAVAIMRAAGASDSVIKGVTTMAETVQVKGNKKLSKESRAYLAERVAALAKACDELKVFIADDPEEGDEEDDRAGVPNEGQEVGTDVDEPQKQYVIDLVEKAST